jgi:hypothetical protein
MNKMVFDSPKVLARAKPGRGGWVKTNLRCDGLLLLPVDEDQINMEKQ